MTITDLINEVKQSRNKVIPTSYILNRLREVERHDNDLDEHLPTNESNVFARLVQDVKEVI